MSDTPVTSSAVFSPCRRYRYLLERWWDEERLPAAFIGLNPSTADEQTDDPTIRRCIRFARDWGYGGLLMVNLFGLRSTDPRKLRTVSDPVGPSNDHYLDEARVEARITIAAWGTRGDLMGRGDLIARRTPGLHCLGVTKDGHPRHPLYMRSDCRPIQYRTFTPEPASAPEPQDPPTGSRSDGAGRG